MGLGWQVCSVISVTSKIQAESGAHVRVSKPPLHVRCGSGTAIKHAHRLFCSFRVKSLRMIPIS